MVITQSNQTPFSQYKNNTFPIDSLKGSIGQAIVKTYFCHFGYEIYPFGYENHWANITRFVKKDYSDDTITKIRAMPDLLVFDRDKEESYLLEIKASNKNESEYMIDKDEFEIYKKHWKEAFLVIYFIRTAKILCCKIGDIKELGEEPFGKDSKIGYRLNFDNFRELPDYFGKIEREKYDNLSQEIKKTLGTFSQASAE